jgi:hypothetical protein
MSGILDAAAPSHGEAIPPGEVDAAAAITASIVQLVRRDAAIDGAAHRDAHPKMHGCLVAEFSVLAGLPAGYRAGIFAAPGRYKALIRFSNGNARPQPDVKGDGRGMAVKLLGVAESVSGTQDFIAINHPVFFVRNAVDYVDFQVKGFGRFIFASLVPPRIRLHEAFAALAIVFKRPDNPLNLRYWSMTPYLLGERACKFSFMPVGPLSAFVDRTDPDFMRLNMARHLAAAGAAFELRVQLRGDPARMPVEDPTIEWREAEAPFVAVARLTIPAQVFDTPARREFGENLSFTPWHALPVHRPLGGINRVRRLIYETISQLRHGMNAAPRAEPENLPPLEE